jgi:hypothetical protein
VYDMYRWDQAAPARARRRTPDGRPRPGRKPATSMPNGAARPARSPAQAAQAVQVALDRRDNGGDPASSADQ